MFLLLLTISVLAACAGTLWPRAIPSVRVVMAFAAGYMIGQSCFIFLDNAFSRLPLPVCAATVAVGVATGLGLEALAARLRPESLQSALLTLPPSVAAIAYGFSFDGFFPALLLAFGAGILLLAQCSALLPERVRLCLLAAGLSGFGLFLIL